MAIYLITGKLGSGKTLACVGRIRDALLAGKRVATNLDLNLEKLLPHIAREVVCYRVPDKPSVDDLEAIGLGNDSPDEDGNGLIVLDELGAWLNTRDFQDKARKNVIDWLLHSRKKGWDVYFIIQHANMLDKQVREGLAEFLVSCRRTDRLRIPFIGAFIKVVTTVDLRPPKIHIGTVRYGVERDALVVDRWWYRARDLYDAYDTRQIFTDAPRGVSRYLSPWHVSGRYLRPSVSLWARMRRWMTGDAQRRPAPKPRRDLVCLLSRLPADTRIRHWQRLAARGAFE